VTNDRRLNDVLNCLSLLRHLQLHLVVFNILLEILTVHFIYFLDNLFLLALLSVVPTGNPYKATNVYELQKKYNKSMYHDLWLVISEFLILLNYLYCFFLVHSLDGSHDTHAEGPWDPQNGETTSCLAIDGIKLLYLLVLPASFVYEQNACQKRGCLQDQGWEEESDFNFHEVTLGHNYIWKAI
jgi:hypothetical protein